MMREVDEKLSIKELGPNPSYRNTIIIIIDLFTGKLFGGWGREKAPRRGVMCTCERESPDMAYRYVYYKVRRIASYK